jgi:flagellar protein FliS
MSTLYSRAYLLTKVLTAGRREVILYLYEGALGSLARAIEARRADDRATAGREIDRVIAILIELSGSLDYDKNGELALRLDGIYNYMIEALTASNNGDEEPLQACEGVLTILCDAWRQALASEDNGAERERDSVPQVQMTA